MKTNQLKGFTILETLIGLLLMSIIISLTYALFNLMNKQLSLLGYEQDQILEYNLFNSTLLGDIEQAHDFYVSDNEIVLKNYDETDIKYALNKHFVLRQSSMKIDTFKVNVINYEFPNQKSNNDFLNISLNVLNDTIKANYLLKKDNAQILNAMFLNEN